MADGINGDEGFGIGLFHVIHQAAIFLIIHDGDDFLNGLVVVCADDRIKRCAAVQFVQDELRDLFEFRGDDAHAPLDIHAEDKMIDHHTAEIRAQHAEHHGLLVVAQSRGEGDQHAGNRHGLTELHAQEFVHQLGDDIQTAGGGIARKQQRKAYAHHQDIADDIEHRILCNRLEIRENDFVDAHDSRHQYGAVDGLCAKVGTDEQEANHQQEDIEYQRDRRYGKGDEIGDHHRQRGAAAHGYMAGQHEEKDRGGNDDGADGDDGEFADVLSGEHEQSSMAEMRCEHDYRR